MWPNDVLDAARVDDDRLIEAKAVIVVRGLWEESDVPAVGTLPPPNMRGIAAAAHEYSRIRGPNLAWNRAVNRDTF